MESKLEQENRFDKNIKNMLKDYPMEFCDSSFTADIMEEVKIEYTIRQKRKSFIDVLIPSAALLIIAVIGTVFLAMRKTEITKTFDFIKSDNVSYLFPSLLTILLLIVIDAVIRKKLYKKYN